VSAQQRRQPRALSSQALNSETYPPYLTPERAVAYLDLPSLNALRKRVRTGCIPSWCWTRMGGKSVRFIKSALDEWLQGERRRAAIALADGERRRG
jgi:hypothetical protein